MGRGHRRDDPPFAADRVYRGRRFRGMMPIASECSGSMAYAIIGGVFVATLLTLRFLPALNVVCFRIKKPARSDRYQSKNRRLRRRAA